MAKDPKTTTKPSKTKRKRVNDPDRAMKKKLNTLLMLKVQEGIDRDPRKCIYRRHGKFCEKWSIAGGTVCATHGGSIGHVKKAAQKRLNDLLLRKVERLDEISEQSIHMPSALGATQSIINRVMGKVGDAPSKGNVGPTIQIGVAFGAKEPSVMTVTAQQLPGVTEEVIDVDIDNASDD